MQAITYYLFLPLLYLIRILPFWIIYRIADLLYLLLFYVFKYRKKIVKKNLQNSFPEKSEEEINAICKDFFKHFADLILEVIKSEGMNEKEALKRCKSIDLSPLHKYQNRNQSILLAMGHYGNWEWGSPVMPLQTTFKSFCVYQELANPYFDKFIFNLRSRFGVTPVERKNIAKAMIRHKSDVTITALVSDQTPLNLEDALWFNFLNQDTPFFKGTEKLAKLLNYPVVFISINKVKRGYYEAEMVDLIENPRATAEGEITEAFVRALEQRIQKAPAYWLWSHNRWKRKR